MNDRRDMHIFIGGIGRRSLLTPPPSPPLMRLLFLILFGHGIFSLFVAVTVAVAVGVHLIFCFYFISILIDCKRNLLFVRC